MKLNIKAFEKLLEELPPDQVMTVDGQEITAQQVKEYLAKVKKVKKSTV